MDTGKTVRKGNLPFRRGHRPTGLREMRKASTESGTFLALLIVLCAAPEKAWPQALPWPPLELVRQSRGILYLEIAPPRNGQVPVKIVETVMGSVPKGGIVLAICDELQLPIELIGVGEGLEDMAAFNAPDFVEALTS